MAASYHEGQTAWSQGNFERARLRQDTPRQRKIEKLKRPTERPGTEAEGETARRMIDRTSSE